MAWERYQKAPEKEHNKTRRSGCAAINQAMVKYSLNIEPTPTELRMHTVRQQDIRIANRTSMTRGKKKYTDGSLTRDPDRAGWGLVEYDRDPVRPARVTNGRLKGEQDNYKAESKALLDALVNQHPLACRH